MPKTISRRPIIAVDFDGTLCENKWPDIGTEKWGTIKWVKQQQKVRGARIILWTNRMGARLADAVEWCEAHGLHFDAVNENLPEVLAAFITDCRKVVADVYLDDKAMSAAEVERIMLGTEPGSEEAAAEEINNTEKEETSND